jgi:Plasmid pRiA4b ORF-3-like protein
MPRRSRLEPPIYTFRVRIRGGYYAPPEATTVWRDIEIAANQTLADLGDVIPLAFDFDDPHLWSFFLSGKAWDRATQYALRSDFDPMGEPDSRAADLVQIRDVPFPGVTGKKEFLFLFDYGDEWHFGVKLRRLNDRVERGAPYPRVVAEQGKAPPQYPHVEEDDWDEADDES